MANAALLKLIQEQAAKYNTNRENAVKLKQGKNVIRIIAPEYGQVPWIKEDGDFSRPVGVHWIKQSEGSKPLAVVGSREVCYGELSQLSLAIDNAIANAYDETTKKLFTDWKPAQGVLVNIVNRMENDAVQVMEMPKGVYGQIVSLVALHMTEADVNILDHNTGTDIVINRTGSGMTNTKYEVSLMPLAPGKVSPPVTQDQISRAVDLDAYIASRFFKPGEEEKALAIISNITGLPTPRLGTTSVAPQIAAPRPQLGATLPPATQTPAPAIMAAAAAPVQQVQVPPVENTTTVAATSIEDLQREIARLQAAAAVQTAAPVQMVAPAPTSVAGFSDQSDADALLAELNLLGAI